MAEKDILEKVLADYNDVFADIVNVLLFDGEQVVNPDDLETVKDRSQYKADGRVHEQERDVAKRLKDSNATIALFGFEHQTAAERYMPIRQIGYDGQSYRAQLLKKGSDHIHLHPVITMVLYFGTERWPYSQHLTDHLVIPERFRAYVSDYEMKNLFEISYLTPEQVSMFKSDFRYVADYFVQKRMTHDYHPGPDIVRHVDETLKLMSVLTGDRRFEEVVSDLPNEKGVNMCEILDRVENRGIEKGLIKGKQEGIALGKLEGMTQIYYTEMHYSADQIAQKLDKPVDQIQALIQQMAKA